MSKDKEPWEKEWHYATFTCPEDNSTIQFFHNIKEESELVELFDQWNSIARVLTAKSFCMWLGNQREDGLHNHYAFTEEVFRSILPEETIDFVSMKNNTPSHDLN